MQNEQSSFPMFFYNSFRTWEMTNPPLLSQQYVTWTGEELDAKECQIVTRKTEKNNRVARTAEKNNRRVAQTAEKNKIDLDSTLIFKNNELNNCIVKLNFTNKNYESTKNGDLERLYDTISMHPVFDGMGDYVDDPEHPSQHIHQFELMICGVKMHDKKNMLNNALLVFGESYKLKGHDNVDITIDVFIKKIVDACYQPNTVDHFHKLLFSNFAKQGLLFKKGWTFMKKVLSRPFGKSFSGNVQISIQLSMIVDPKLLYLTCKQKKHSQVWWPTAI